MAATAATGVSDGSSLVSWSSGRKRRRRRRRRGVV
jgi:hypothetical protein